MLKLSLQRTACLWLLCLLTGFVKAQDVTATWNFQDEETISQLIAASESTESDTIKINGIDFIIEANGNKIEAAQSGIKTDDGVTFKVQVESNLDIVTVNGGEDFAYTIGDMAAVEANTNYSPTETDVNNGYVMIVNNGGSLLSISAVQKEKPKPLDPPALDALTINGTKYAVETLFGQTYEAELVIDFDDVMVSASNPVTAIAKTGAIESITYDGDDTKCTVIITMSSEDMQTVQYKLNIKQKPSAKLTYYDSDGITVLGESRRELGAIIDHFDVNFDAVTVEEGYKMRGWYHEPDGGLRYTIGETVNTNISLYAITTAIEEASTSAIYDFNLTDIYFDPANHEAFNPKGDGFHWFDDVHGWAFKDGNQIDLLVGPKATISIKLCQENDNDTILIKSEAGDTLSILKTDVKDDGDIVNYMYNGEGGTISLFIKTSTEVKIHGIRIINTAETNYTNIGNWFIVSPGDAKSFLEVVDLANTLNSTKNTERLYIFLPKGTYDLGDTVETTISGHNISIIGESPDILILKMQTLIL